MDFTYPGEKLLHPSLYGTDEYLIIGLVGFVVFVALKHLIFHTFYFWWYCHGQFFIPNKYWSLITGKSLSQRVLRFVSSKANESHNMSIDHVMSIMDAYFKTKEFAPSLSTVKGNIVDNLICEHQPKEVLVVGCHVGYVLLQILRSLPKDARIVTIESKEDFIISAKSLLKLVGLESKVIFICAEPNQDALQKIRSDYGVSRLDFVFLNRIKHGEPSYVSFLKLLEGNATKDDGYLYTKGCGGNGRKSMLLADKVVMPGDPEFLKYVRLSDQFDTQYFQMSLEHTSEEIIDGMEKAVYVG